jgi:hypothetical protein
MFPALAVGPRQASPAMLPIGRSRAALREREAASRDAGFRVASNRCRRIRAPMIGEASPAGPRFVALTTRTHGVRSFDQLAFLFCSDRDFRHRKHVSTSADAGSIRLVFYVIRQRGKAGQNGTKPH